MVIISYRRFGTIGPETSVRNYHYRLSNIAEERRSQKIVFFIVTALRTSNLATHLFSKKNGEFLE
jgi:hypothetical protein